MAVQRHSTNVSYETTFGYCRALRVGTRIVVSGTLGIDADGKPAAEDAYGQAKAAIDRIVGAIEAVGGKRSDVIRTRMFATHPQRDVDLLARAHREAFGEHPPVATLVGTSEVLIDGCVIEIEADAEVGAGDA